jgi:hypothetical protein
VRAATRSAKISFVSTRDGGYVDLIKQVTAEICKIVHELEGMYLMQANGMEQRIKKGAPR